MSVGVLGDTQVSCKCLPCHRAGVLIEFGVFGRSVGSDYSWGPEGGAVVVGGVSRILAVIESGVARRYGGIFCLGGLRGKS